MSDVEIEELIVEVPDGHGMTEDEIDELSRRAVDDYVARLVSED